MQCHGLGVQETRKKFVLWSYLSDRTCNKCQPNFVLHFTTLFKGALKAASSNSGTWTRHRKRLIMLWIKKNKKAKDNPKVAAAHVAMPIHEEEKDVNY